MACDSLGTLESNNTQTLIADLEALREHLRIDRWLLHGVSWGCTLALAYALEHSDRVTSLVLTAVTSGSREEIDWITEGVGMMFPEAWARFRSPAREGERVVEAYARMLRESDPAIRADAASSWEKWESTHGSLDPNWSPGPMFEDDRERLNFATLVTHYWANDCFLAGPDRVRDRIAQLADIPGVLIHGRHDISGPAVTPWSLHQAWPNSELIVVENEGHGGEQEMELTTDAISRFAEHPLSDVPPRMR
jgi:proline iminopeptidase